MRVVRVLGFAELLVGIHRCILDLYVHYFVFAVVNCSAACRSSIWERDFPVIVESMLEAAEATGAVLVWVDNLYMFGPEAAQSGIPMKVRYSFAACVFVMSGVLLGWIAGFVTTRETVKQK